MRNISEEAKLGSEVVIGENVIIERGCVIGDHVRLGNHQWALKLKNSVTVRVNKMKVEVRRDFSKMHAIWSLPYSSL